MSQIHPTVRYLIVCEDVQTDALDKNLVTLVHLITAIRSTENPPYPLLYREICVYLQLTECRGPAEGHIEICYDDSEKPMFRTRKRTISFGSDPLEVVGVVFRIRNLLFQQPGLYWIQLWYNDEMIAQQPILLK